MSPSVASSAWGLGTKIAYGSLAFNSAKFAYSPSFESGRDVALDAFGVGFLRYAPAAQGLLKTSWLAADIGVNAYQGYTGFSGAHQDYRSGNYLSGTLNAVSGLFGVAGAAAGTRGLASAYDNLPLTLAGLQNRIDIYAWRAERAAWNQRLSGTEAGNYADRYLSRAVSRLNRRLEAVQSEYRAYTQYGRSSLGRELFGNNRPAGSLFLDAVLTNVDRTRVYSGWDIRFQSTPYPRWNKAATNADYVRRFRIEDGFVREISVEARRP